MSDQKQDRPRSAAALYIEEFADLSNLTYDEIAKAAGFKNASTLRSFIADEYKIPLDHVARLATALGCDGAQLALLVLQQWFHSSSFRNVCEAFQIPRTENELLWLAALEKASGESSPVLTPERAAKLISVFLE